MAEGAVQIYYGEGRGKTTAAVGSAVHAAMEGKEAIIIQFLKGKSEVEPPYLSKLEPEIKRFSFAKYEDFYDDLDEESRQEEIMNLQNGFNYAKKVITTEACNLVILDEILGLVDHGVVSIEELGELLRNKPEEMTIICTGRVLDDRLRPFADEIYNIAPEK